jgi:pyrroloquinoline quinone (PQQ) biosynthesis protein C
MFSAEANGAVATWARPVRGMEDIAVRCQGTPAGPKSDHTEPRLSAIEDFPNTMAALLEVHRPSRMPFFGRLTALPRSVASDPSFLGRIHLVYQSAMHATRAAVYYLPHLDSPALRKRKLQILIDDDGLPNGDTHHYQLTRAFLSIGAQCLLDEEEFGEPGELCHYLEGETAQFVRLAPKLYSRSLGPWCVIETMSADWMRALADALSVHFPQFKHQPYFEECFAQEIEERHAAEAIEITQTVLRARPELLYETLRDAKIMAEALDGVWAQLDRIVRSAGPRIPLRRRIAAERSRATRARRAAPAEPSSQPARAAIEHGRFC